MYESAAEHLPPRSISQRMDALDRANEIRSFRANLKRDLKAGREELTGLILNPPEMIETMKLHDLILATPKLGRVKVDKLLRNCKISSSKTIGGLSERQRNELVHILVRR